MIKKFGICFVVISLVACIFCGSVFASSEVADGGGSSNSEVGYFPAYADLVTLWNTTANTNKITKDDIKYLICVKDSDFYYIMGSNKPFFGVPNGSFPESILDITVSEGRDIEFYRFFFDHAWSYKTCYTIASWSIYNYRVNNVYGNHQYSYSFADGTTGFFFNPQWSLETITRTPLKNLTSDFGRDSLTVSRVGSIILASLLGIILLKRWGNSLT